MTCFRHCILRINGRVIAYSLHPNIAPNFLVIFHVFHHFYLVLTKLIPVQIRGALMSEYIRDGDCECNDDCRRNLKKRTIRLHNRGMSLIACRMHIYSVRSGIHDRRVCLRPENENALFFWLDGANLQSSNIFCMCMVCMLLCKMRRIWLSSVSRMDGRGAIKQHFLPPLHFTHRLPPPLGSKKEQWTEREGKKKKE